MKICFKKLTWKKKVEKYKLIKLSKKIKTIYKNGLKVIKFDDTEIEEFGFHQNKSPITIHNIVINKLW